MLLVDCLVDWPLSEVVLVEGLGFELELRDLLAVALRHLGHRRGRHLPIHEVGFVGRVSKKRSLGKLGVEFVVKFCFAHDAAAPLLPVVNPGGNPVPGGNINATLNADPIC